MQSYGINIPAQDAGKPHDCRDGFPSFPEPHAMRHFAEIAGTNRLGTTRCRLMSLATRQPDKATLHFFE